MKNIEFEYQMRRHAARLKDSMAAPFAAETEDFILKNTAEKRKNIRLRKTVAIVAVAACFLLGSTAFAISLQGGIFSWSEKEYTQLPQTQQVVEDVGYEPVILQSFENGFSYSTGYAVNNESMDEATGSVEKFKSACFEYEKDGELVYFWQEKFEIPQPLNGRPVGIAGGVELYYSSYVNKIVPADYQMSEEDIQAEANGELVFTWGSDSVQTMEVKNLSWVKDGVNYMLLQMGGSLSADDMRAMAAEAIGN